MPLLPFTIDDVPDAVIDLVDGAVGSRRRPATTAPEARPATPAGADEPSYVYRGPLGPVYESYARHPERTLVFGDHVVPGRFDLGSPHSERPTMVAERLRYGVGGTIGDQHVQLRLSPDVSPRMRCLDIVVGDDRYAMVAAGLFPRVALHRGDHGLLAAFTVRGRRPHRIAADASDLEVVLTAFVVRFVMRLAHLR